MKSAHEMEETKSGDVCEKLLMKNTIQILDDENQNLLSEILRCNICLELPLGKKVKICEKGHHFCETCHKNMKCCGFCRGNLLESRNLAVEQLVSKLAPILNNSTGKLPTPKPPCPPSKGSFKCLHHCSAKVPASMMLSHLRTAHPTHLIDGVRSNPFSDRFSFTYDVEFAEKKQYVWSVQVSDMGLFTVDLSFFNCDFWGCVRVLGDQTVASLFRYQLLVRIPKSASKSFQEISVTNCTVSSYLDNITTLRHERIGLKIKKQDLLEHTDLGSALTIFFSVWKSSEITESKSLPSSSVVCVPERCLFFKNDRKIRRNRNRNVRRKRVKKKMGDAASVAGNSEQISEEFSKPNSENIAN